MPAEKLDKHFLKLLNSAYREYDDERVKDKNILHVSDLKNFCAREYALCIKNGQQFQRKQFHPVGMRFTFEIGNHIEDIITKRLFKTKHLLGTWECINCGNWFFGFYDTKIGCSKCKSKAVAYRNTTLELRINKDIIIRGNKDVLVFYAGNEVYIVEVKSIRPDDFKVLECPERDHGYQVSLYMWMIKEGAKILHAPAAIEKKFKIMTDKAVIVYACKGHQNKPFKPFEYKRDNQFLAVVEKKIDELKSFSKTNKIPKPICETPAKSMAKKCRVRDLCFQKRKK